MLEEAFCYYDKNSDGYLQLHEMRQALHFLGFPSQHHKLKNVFEKYDTDGDNLILFNEFEKIVECELDPFLHS